MAFIKRHFIGICIGVIGTICLLGVFVVLCLCLANGWGYYFFDVIAKSSPAIVGASAYWMWSRNREKELKELEYRNDYYKKIIDRRMEVYDEVYGKILEPVILTYSYSANQELHKIFLKKDDLLKYRTGILAVVAKNTWMSHDLITKIRKIDNIVKNGLKKSKNDEELIQYGIDIYAEFKTCVQSAAISCRHDWINLHKIDEFFKDKNTNTEKS